MAHFVSADELSSLSVSTDAVSHVVILVLLCLPRVAITVLVGRYFGRIAVQATIL
ncbi:unnamed protein product [Ectocarpus sp. CCAP 1310/34]|nr:unnamed protein product [Ectocarpus sp. CCAP 1310/34]